MESNQDAQPGKSVLDGTDSPQTEIDALRKQIEDLRRELQQAQQQQLYDRAEVENFKRRMQKETADAVRFAAEPLLRDLLPIIDNLERAVSHAEIDNPVVEGVQLVLKMLVEALGRHGVNRIEALGQPFDPNKHEAIAQVGSDVHPALHVADQHLIGYELHDRLLRPAMVSVSSGKPVTAVESTKDSD